MNFVVYLLFALVPFTNMAIGGHVYLLEIPLLLCLFLLPFAPGKKLIKLTFLDVLVFIYALFSLISVAVGVESLYESARHYRLMVLTPVLIYFVVRLVPQKIENLRTDLYFMLPAIVWQVVLFIQFYITHGQRPVNVPGAVSTVTLSLLFCFGISILFFIKKKERTAINKLLALFLGALFLVALFLNATRASIIGFVFLTPLVIYIWRKIKFKKRFSYLVMFTIVLLLGLIVSNAILFKDLQIEVSREVEKSIERVYSPELYLADFRGRLFFWGVMAQKAMEHPILGTGAASHNIGFRGGTLFSLGTVHNMFVSMLITSGVPGLILLLSIIAATYSVLNKIQSDNEIVNSIGKFVLLNFSILLLVATTNDLSGGRVFLFFLLMALSAKLPLLDSLQKEEMS